MSGSWDAMLEAEERRSALQRRRELARKSKAELVDLIMSAEATEHEIRRHTDG